MLDTLPNTMRALKIHAPKAPLVVEEVPMPELKSGEVLVKIAGSPINPSDLASLEGQYAVDWTFPFTPGMEGSGRVVGHNAGRMGQFLQGKKVALFAGRMGLWAEYAAVPADRVVPVGEKTGFDQAAMSLVNPLTAIALINIAEKKGITAIVNTAARGALGQMIRKRAVAKGLKVINVVRRESHVQELKEQGAIHVLNQTSPDFVKELRELCNHYRAKLAFDAVGGDLTLDLLRAQPKGGEVMIYGGLAMKPTAITPDHFIFHNKKISGFWLVSWMAEQSFPRRALDLMEVRRNFDGFAASHIARVLELEEAGDAAQMVLSNMSEGKVMISPNGYDVAGGFGP